MVHYFVHTSQVPKGKPGAAGKKTSTATGVKKQVQSQTNGSRMTGKFNCYAVQ
jgi:hypothetical protein